MDCLQIPPSDGLGYLRYFNARMAKLRVPVNGSLELTRRCNLRCVHCYVPQEQNRGLTAGRELTTSQVCGVIDEITEAGCLNFLITGGEPLLRPDFQKIYRHAVTRGLLVTVFTNGTLVTDELVALFRDLPPRSVEVSLYGATAETYTTVTGVPGAFRHCLDGIERLIAGGVRVGLKTVLLRDNVHEIDAMEAVAHSHAVEFRLDAALLPRLDGDRAPIACRVDPAKAVAIEFSSPRRAGTLAKFFERSRNQPAAETVYDCGAGQTHFSIDPYGILQPCLLTTQVRYPLVGGRFVDGWQNVMPRIREKKIAADNACGSCDKRPVCGYCPSFFMLEEGSEERRSAYLCEMGYYRHQAIATAASV